MDFFLSPWIFCDIFHFRSVFTSEKEMETVKKTDATREECIEKYIKMVYRIAFHYFGNCEDAEDVTQDVFLKIFSSNISRENDEELKAWIIRVTTNLCHSRYRNPFVRKRAELEGYEWEQMSCYDTGEQDYINRKVVMDAVLSLPDRYRIIVYLYYYEEYSCRQISSILQLKETTVQTRLARAREKLKCLLQSSFPEKGDSNGF